jgi:hypothetical protein
MKKEITPKYKRLENKDIREKKRQPKNEGTRKQRHPMKKEVTPKRKGLENKDL